ncbi:MAG: M12 family metallo-peptidase [Prevotellaceae bacterium]|jgi:gliding motility-associated-like protein|nr:M12 family metallo-peptidase [Prevotellaceae bacterium]
MKRIIKHISNHFLIKLFSIVIGIISAVGLLNAQTGQTFNINSETSLQNLMKQENNVLLSNIFPAEVEKFRLFEYNTQLKNFTAQNSGDILMLDFFDNKKYRATVQKVTVGYDGIVGITAKILDTEYGYCFISVSEKGISISADIPQLDEQYFVATKNGKSYLSLYKMSELKKNELGCDDIDLPQSDSLQHINIVNTEFAENTVSDANDCTFPPDALSDQITVNVMIVYTENAEQWALNDNSVTDIDDLINQAMLRTNISHTNSLTGITFNLAYKHKTDYTEVNTNQDLYNLTYDNDGYMDEVHDLRKQYKADLVMFIPEVDFTGGVAWLLGNYIPGDGRPDYGFGLSRVQQTSFTYTMVHEMGHNMGCGHHWQQNYQAGPGLFSYSSGYRGQDASLNWYSTIMTYESGTYFPDGNYAPRIAFFSSPDIIHGGVNIGDATYADNVFTLRQSKHAVSRYSDYYVAGLQCLNVSEGSLSPAFHTDIVNYTVIVSSGVSSITVYATPSHPSSTVITGTGQHTLSCGSNIINVTVQTPVNTTKSYTINVIRLCTVTVLPTDTEICQEGSATLTAYGEPNATFKWYDSPTGGTLLHTGSSYTVSPLQTTHYYVSQTVSGIESNRTEAIVTVNPTYNININETICTGESYLFNGNSYTETGIHTANLLSSSGCDSIVTLTLVVMQSCNPQSINIDNDYYELTYGDNSFNFNAAASSGLPLTFSVSGTSVAIQNISAGQYSLTINSVGTTVITFFQAGDSYFAEKEESVTVNVRPAELTVKAKDYTINAGDAFPTLAYSCSGFVYGEDSTVFTKFPTISCAVANTKIPGEYSVIISGAAADNYTIKHINGILKIKKSGEQLPNAFTPHNADRINDTFGIGYDLRIFNRWGMCLYEGKEGWDGKYKGRAVSPGVYYYRAKDTNGNEHKGSVMLIK